MEAEAQHYTIGNHHLREDLADGFDLGLLLVSISLSRPRLG
jgi:hypothetical protein